MPWHTHHPYRRVLHCETTQFPTYHCQDFTYRHSEFVNYNMAPHKTNRTLPRVPIVCTATTCRAAVSAAWLSLTNITVQCTKEKDTSSSKTHLRPAEHGEHGGAFWRTHVSFPMPLLDDFLGALLPLPASFFLLEPGPPPPLGFGLDDAPPPPPEFGEKNDLISMLLEP